MLSKLIVESYKTFIEISLWLSLALFVIGGWQITSGPFGGGSGFTGALIGAVIWFVVAVVFFGAFLVLEDIRERVKNIEAAKGAGKYPKRITESPKIASTKTHVAEKERKPVETPVKKAPKAHDDLSAKRVAPKVTPKGSHPYTFKHGNTVIKHNNKTYMVGDREFTSVDEARTYIDKL